MFSNKLKNLREQKGLTQRDLAKLLNMSYGAIGLYETGKREPDFNILQKIADYFGVTTDFLIGHGNKTNLTSENYLDNSLQQFVYDRTDKENQETLELLKRAAALPEKDKKLLSEIVDRLREKL